jgi:hypothetical protein
MLIGLVFLFTGCATVEFIPVYSDETYAPSNIEESAIPVVSGDLKRKYKEIGVIIVEEGECSTKNSIVKVFKSKAKEVGAQAVIKVQRQDKIVGASAQNYIGNNYGYGNWGYSTSDVDYQLIYRGIAVIFE